MGKDKYLMDCNGKPQYLHIWEMLRSMAIPTFISCADNQSSDLQNDNPKIIDMTKNIGPMAGLEAAIMHDPTSSWLIIACDLIHINATAIRRLQDNNDLKNEVTTFLKTGSSFPETTFTIYNPKSFAHIKNALKAKDYSLQRVLKKCDVKLISPINDKVLTNANTPEDLI